MKKDEQKKLLSISYYIKTIIKAQEYYELRNLYNSYLAFAKDLNYSTMNYKEYSVYLEKIKCPMERVNDKVFVYLAENPSVVNKYLASIGAKVSEKERTSVDILFDSYKKFCNENKYDSGSRTFFRKKLEMIGFKVERTNGFWTVFLISIFPTVEEQKL